MQLHSLSMKLNENSQVNAANSSLAHGGGVAGAVSRAGNTLFVLKPKTE
jgi:O-acetyl-ADP-ribose deacetylase (regulator of RNase III)